jgi:hypothetical protein
MHTIYITLKNENGDEVIEKHFKFSNTPDCYCRVTDGLLEILDRLSTEEDANFSDLDE